MRAWIAIVVLFAAVLACPAYAQEVQPAADTPATMAEASVSVWPEYDRPGVLVIYRGQFAPDTPLPLPVEIGIPSSAGVPTAVAFLAEGGAPFNQPYTTRVEGERLVVSFELQTTGFQLEYYAPLDTASQERAFAYTFSAEYAVTALALDFQAPPTAQGFELTPAATAVTRGEDGLTYHIVEAGSLGQGEERTWTVTYQKPGTDLTNPGVPSPTAVPVELAAQGEGPDSAMLTFLFAFVALVGVGAAAFWLGRRTQPAVDRRGGGARRDLSHTQGLREAAQAQRGKPGPEGMEEAHFCHQCGARLREGAEYCARCGARVRGS